ncbi:MAG: hypothetical protein V7637_1047, partial [Mycobacteriales bacterium]
IARVEKDSADPHHHTPVTIENTGGPKTPG